VDKFEPDFAQVAALLVLAGMLGYWFGLTQAWKTQDQNDLRRRVMALEFEKFKGTQPVHPLGVEG
jgi:hypothetical protein